MALPSDAISLEDAQSKTSGLPSDAISLSGEEQTSSYNPTNPAAYNARFESPEAQSAFEQQNPRGAESLKERLYGPSGATVQQSFMASLPRDPNFKAYSAEKSGLDVVGIDKKQRLIIRNPATGDVAPLDGNFFRDKAGAVGQWIKPAAQMATMAVADTLGTMGTGPVGGAALASAAAGATDLVFQKVSQDWVGEPMSAGHAAGETAGAAAGYATFGAAKMGAEGFAKLVQKSVKHLGSGAKEMIQGVTQVKKEPLDWLWKEMETMKPGGKVSDVIHPDFLSLDIPQKLSRKAIYGSETADHSLVNLVDNFKKNMKAAKDINGNIDVKKVEAIREMYKSTLGPEADNALMIEMLAKPNKILLDPKATSENGLSYLTDKVVDSLDRGERAASQIFAAKKSDILARRGNADVSLKSVDNSFISMMSQFGHVESSKLGKAGPDIFAFNEDKLSKPAVALYKDFMDRLGYKVGTGIDGRTTIFERPKDIKLHKLWKTIEDFQTRLDKAIDPMKGTLSDQEAAPLSRFIKDLREKRNSVDPSLEIVNKMWTDVSETKRAFKAAKAQGLSGEKGMIQKFQEVAANASGKNETFGAAKTNSLRNVLSELDAYPFMKGRELLPMIDEGVASAKLGNLSRNGALDEAVNKFSATMQHALPTTGNIQSEAAKDALKTIDAALPKDNKFLYQAQRHLTNLAFNKPGSIYQARWLAFTLGGMLGMTHMGPAGILAGVGLASKIQKPELFAKKVIPFLTGAGKAVGQPSSALHEAGSYLGRQVFAQAGRKAGGDVTSS